MATFVPLILLLSMALSSNNHMIHVNGCYTSIISFGDSLADTGNLKQIYTNSHIDPPRFFFPPYGETFFRKVTGRCSDGRLIIDFIAEALGLLQMSPYERMKTKSRMEIGQGINFAVIGATALDSSFHEAKGILNPFTNASLGVQLNWFKQLLASVCIPGSAEALGLLQMSPYERMKTKSRMEIGQGINFAVIGATALDSSFHEAKGVLNPFTNASLGVQLNWFKQLLASVCIPGSGCKNLLRDSLILMGEIGGNDYNHPLLAGKPLDEIKAYVPRVIDIISSTLNDLIDLGAQTLAVPGNLPIGCSAGYLAYYYGSEELEYDNTTSCLIKLNEFTEYHNMLLQIKLDEIRERHPNINVVYADYYNAAMQIFRSPQEYGFTNGALTACCGGGGPYNYNPLTPCSEPSSTSCDHPETYFNWDGLHLTEAGYHVLYKSLFQGPYTSPQFNTLCPTSNVQRGDTLSSSM